MSEEHGGYRVEGQTEPRRETRLPFASPRYQAPTKDEFRSLTQTLGLTGSMAGQLLGVTSRAIRKWIGGESEVPYSAWRLLLTHAGLALEDPDETEFEDHVNQSVTEIGELRTNIESQLGIMRLQREKIAEVESRLEAIRRAGEAYHAAPVHDSGNEWHALAKEIWPEECVVERRDLNKLIADDMAPAPDGEYVKLDDHQKLALRLEAVRTLVEADHATSDCSTCHELYRLLVENP